MRLRALLWAVTAVVGGGFLAPVAGQTSAGPRDLSGVWDFRSITPLERPAEAGDKAFLTPEEAAALEAQAEAARIRQNAPSEIRTEPLPAGGGGRQVGGYNAFWLDFGTTLDESRRTSLIVDPPNGRLPALTPRGETLRQELSLWEDLPATLPIRVRSAGTGTDGPEHRGLAERCLVGFNTGPPMLPSGYNNHMQIFQGEGTVAILNEMVHDTRVVPVGDHPRLPAEIRQWAGSSRGRWEGDTLVVETTNFTDRTASFDPNPMAALGSGEHLHLTERFRRLDDDTLLYEFTIDDPMTFTEPFTVSVAMRRSDEPVFEYACHEGNYGLLNILRGARAEDRAAAHADR